MRTPTRRGDGEGRIHGEGIDMRTHGVRRGIGRGRSEERNGLSGETRWGGAQASNVILGMAAFSGSRTGAYERRGRVTPAEQRPLASEALSKREGAAIGDESGNAG